jgi:hypothetical protein
MGVFFARAHKRRLSLYIAAADYQADRDAPSGDDFLELQKTFIAHIKAEGLHYTPFSNRDQLRAEVLKEPWPEQVRAKPIVLPYASRGSLFKGREAFLGSLAGLLQTTNRLVEAEPLYRRASAITEASFGPDHPQVAILLNNLAHLLQETNRLAEAEPLMRRAVAIFVDFERKTGHAHPLRDTAVQLRQSIGSNGQERG